MYEENREARRGGRDEELAVAPWNEPIPRPRGRSVEERRGTGRGREARVLGEDDEVAPLHPFSNSNLSLSCATAG
jgi:hypothetical protein